MNYIFKHKLETPSPISSLSFGTNGHLLAGSDDGSLRLYHTSSPKVVKAIRGLGYEVSSIACAEQKREGVGLLWLSSSRKAFLFDMDVPQLILSLSDAISTLELGEDDDDVLNELTVNSNRSQLAFSTDSGTVGVVDLSTTIISRMKAKHDNICGAVVFIPDRPYEIVSGGYDSALLHFDFQRGNLLSRRDLVATPPSSGVSLSPPFILSISMSSTGVIAAGTADGQLWLGSSGEKRQATSRSSQKKKRSRKWEGLEEDGNLIKKIAEGPVVAVAFPQPDTLISCTLLGTVTQHHLSRDETHDNLELSMVWTNNIKTFVKVNALAANTEHIAIGGFDEDGKGAIEIWGR